MAERSADENDHARMAFEGKLAIAAPRHVVVRTHENCSVVGDFAYLCPLSVGVVVVRTDRCDRDVDPELLRRLGRGARPGLALGTGDDDKPAVGTCQVAFSRACGRRWPGRVVDQDDGQGDHHHGHARELQDGAPPVMRPGAFPFRVISARAPLAEGGPTLGGMPSPAIFVGPIRRATAIAAGMSRFSPRATMTTSRSDRRARAPRRGVHAP